MYLVLGIFLVVAQIAWHGLSAQILPHALGHARAMTSPAALAEEKNGAVQTDRFCPRSV